MHPDAGCCHEAGPEALIQPLHYRHGLSAYDVAEGAQRAKEAASSPVLDPQAASDLAASLVSDISCISDVDLT